MASDALDSLLKENRVFEPRPEFSTQATIPSLEEYKRLYEFSQKDPDRFWTEQAQQLEWVKKWDKLLEWDPPDAKWFTGGKLNVSYNCLDRHVKIRGSKTAILWEGEPGDQRSLTYAELYQEVGRFSNVLKNLGLKKSDRVILYMPMVPELVIAMLACARLGLVHSVIFGGFSSSAIEDRLHDSQAKLVITADGGWRRGKIIPLKDNVDLAIQKAPFVQHVIVLERTKQKVNWNPQKDLCWKELMEKNGEAGVLQARQLAQILRNGAVYNRA